MNCDTGNGGQPRRQRCDQAVGPRVTALAGQAPRLSARGRSRRLDDPMLDLQESDGGWVPRRRFSVLLAVLLHAVTGDGFLRAMSRGDDGSITRQHVHAEHVRNRSIRCRRSLQNMPLGRAGKVGPALVPRDSTRKIPPPLHRTEGLCRPAPEDMRKHGSSRAKRIPASDLQR